MVLKEKENIGMGNTHFIIMWRDMGMCDKLYIFFF